MADDHPFDPERVLEALNRHGVEFIVVGGVGANAHGGSRVTQDLDAVPTWVTDAGAFDVLGTMETTPGRRLSYEDLAPRAIEAEVSGVRVRVAALSDIIASKETAGRAKDREALPELRRLAAQRTADEGRSFRPEDERPPPRDRPGLER